MERNVFLLKIFTKKKFSDQNHILKYFLNHIFIFKFRVEIYIFSKWEFFDGINFVEIFGFIWKFKFCLNIIYRGFSSKFDVYNRWCRFESTFRINWIFILLSCRGRMINSLSQTPQQNPSNYFLLTQKQDNKSSNLQKIYLNRREFFSLPSIKFSS